MNEYSNMKLIQKKKKKKNNNNKNNITEKQTTIIKSIKFYYCHCQCYC